MWACGKFNYASYISTKMLKLSLIPVSNVHFMYFVEEITWKELLHSVVLCKCTQILCISVSGPCFTIVKSTSGIRKSDFKNESKVFDVCTYKESKADMSMLMCTLQMMHCKFNSLHQNIKLK